MASRDGNLDEQHENENEGNLKTDWIRCSSPGWIRVNTDAS